MIQYIPIPRPHQPQQMSIHPPETEPPLSCVPIRALEIHALGLLRGRDVPRSTALVGDEWAGEGPCRRRDEGCVVGDGAEAVAECVGAVEGFEGLVVGVVVVVAVYWGLRGGGVRNGGLGGEDEGGVVKGWKGHEFF